MKAILKTTIAVSMALSAHLAVATTLTQFSPTGTDVTARGASVIGGIVTELKGTNGTSVVSQLSASSLFVGFASDSGIPFPYNPLTIGTQTGFDASILNALGGGLTSASFRFTLYDGDTASSNFDFNDNTLLVNGINAGNWSAVTTNTTSSTGTLSLGGGNHLGFRDNELDTGWFHVTDSATLANLFGSLSTSSILFAINDIDPNDNFYDFTQGIDGSLINVGSGPVVVPPNPSAVPVPAALPLMASALGLFGIARRKKVA